MGAVGTLFQAQEAAKDGSFGQQEQEGGGLSQVEKEEVVRQFVKQVLFATIITRVRNS